MAIRTWRGLTNSNWGTAGNWLEGATPTNVDDCIFDATSSGCTVNVANAACRSINFTAYTRTITMNNPIAIGANGGSNAGVYLGVNMGISGTGALNLLTANAVLQSNGRIWPNTLNLGTNAANSTSIVSLLDTWNQYGNLGLASGALRYNISGTGQINLYGSTLTTAGQFLTQGGTPKLVIASACTIVSTQAATSPLNLAIDFSAGTNTITIGNLNIGSSRWTHYSGNVVITPGTGIRVLGTANLDVSAITFNNLSIPGTPANGTISHIFYSDVNVTGSFFCSGGTRSVIYSGDPSTSLNLSGGCYLDGLTSGNLATNGPTIRFKGNGVFSNGSMYSLGGEVGANISIECGVNTLTIVGDMRYFQGSSLPKPTFTYTSGVVDLTSHNILLVNSVNLNLAGITMKQVTFDTSTISLLSRLSATTILLNVALAGLTIDGSGGFTTGSLSYTMQANTNVTFQNSVEYVTNNSLFLRGTAVTNTRLTSNDATLRTIFTLKESATQDVAYTTTTRLDSSSGQTIYTRYGTLTDTINWQLLRNPVTKATSFL